MADDLFKNAEPWTLGGRTNWSPEEEKANARRLTAEAILAEEKLLHVKLKRWGQGALGLFTFEVIIMIIALIAVAISSSK